MTGPTDPTQYPPPDRERVEHALHAMHARRARLRRLRLIGVSGGLALFVAVTVAVMASSANPEHRLRVLGQPTTTLTTTPSTTAPSTTPSSTTTPSQTATSTATTPTTTSGSGTQQITYQPFTATGTVDPSLHVTSSVTGTCLTGESGRSYRCFGANPPGGIYDPCFAGPHGTTEPLVCPDDPATPDVVELTATSASSEPSVATTRPWAMQLSNGHICLFVSAAWSGLGPYGCSTHNPSLTPADCRQPQPSQPWWSVECQDQQTAASPFTPNQVTKIWF